MLIVAHNKRGASRTGTLRATAAEIEKVLGFAPNFGASDKVTTEWGFKIGNRAFGIWDYKGSAKGSNPEFSTYGDHDILRQLFGDKYIAG